MAKDSRPNLSIGMNFKEAGMFPFIVASLPSHPCHWYFFCFHPSTLINLGQWIHYFSHQQWALLVVVPWCLRLSGESKGSCLWSFHCNVVFWCQYNMVSASHWMMHHHKATAFIFAHACKWKIIIWFGYSLRYCSTCLEWCHTSYKCTHQKNGKDAFNT